MSESRYLLRQHLFHRWIIVQRNNEEFAWSGSRWVPIGGFVQICNFETREEADDHAKASGLGPEIDGRACV